MNDQPASSAASPDPADHSLAGASDADNSLTGAGGADVSAGISGSGVGGEQIGEGGGEGEGEGDETGLDQVVEEGSRTSWGRPGRPDAG